MSAPAVEPGHALVVATNNPGKLAEFRRLLGGRGLQLVSLREAGYAGDLAEPGETYAENALAKASAVATALQRAALADDSGIEVDSLRGWPGPASARWLGPGRSDAERLERLLDEVRRRSPDDRRARYVCVLALVRPLAEPLLARGECLGELVTPRGTGGFGYDPAFLSADLGMTFGEAAQAAKDGVSHRARALQRLLEFDPALGGGPSD